MIIVKLIGGLGNQMFQYAAGRALALKHGVDLKLDVSQLNKDAAGAYTQRKLELDVFNIEIKIANNDEISAFENLRSNKVLRLLHRKTPFIFSKIYFAESGSLYHPTFKNLPQNAYLEGFWQSEKYFSEIQTVLLKDFELKDKPDASVQFWLDKIKNSNAISVHVRRGDYVSLASASDFHGACSIDYYKHAVEKLSKMNNNCEVFVFSDDMNWCKENLKFIFPTHYVEHEQKAVWDLYLMKHCNHNVIANSSFSWWGAWLNTHFDKTVIAPEYWFKNVKSQSIDILAKHWQMLS